jgi:hypothetical protein
MTVLTIKSSDPNAPVLSGTAGALLPVLDCCLVVRSVLSTANDSAFNDNTTEAILEGGSTFTLFPTPATTDRTYIGMPVPFTKAKLDIAVAGVGGVYVWEYWNGSAWTALSVTDGTSGFTVDGTVTWTAPGSWAANSVNSVTQYWVRVRPSTSPSTNPTVNYLTVGGWTRAYSGTNLAAYRQGTGSNGFLLRIDDTGTVDGRAIGYESMSDVNTGVAGFPTNGQVSGGLYWPKSSTASAAARNWVAVGSEKLLHFHCNHNNDGTSLTGVLCSFGDIKSYKSADAYGTIIMASTATTGTTSNNAHLTGALNAAMGGHYIVRTYAQTGASLNFGKHTDSAKAGAAGANIGGNALAMAYPNGPDAGLYLSPVWISEIANKDVRGEIPGFWAPLHNKPLTHLDTFSGAGVLAGKTFLALNMYNASQAMLETSDTWNT